MANTIRTIPEILALLADNSTGQISAQDVRDAVVSVQGVYGSILAEYPVNTQIIGVTPVLLEQWNISGVALGVDRYCVNTGTNPSGSLVPQVSGMYMVSASVTWIGSNGTKYEFELWKNGAELEPHIGFHKRCNNVADIMCGSLAGIVPLISGDILQIYVEADGAGKTVNVEDAQFTIHKVG